LHRLRLWAFSDSLQSCHPSSFRCSTRSDLSSSRASRCTWKSSLSDTSWPSSIDHVAHVFVSRLSTASCGRLAHAWRGWRTAVHIVTPETVVTSHRRGFRLFWSWKKPTAHGAPSRTARRACSDPGAVHGESPVGCASDSRRTPEVGDRGESIDRGQVHATAPAATVTNLGQILGGDLRTGDVSQLVASTGKPALGMKLDPRSNLLFVAGGPSGTGRVYDATSGAEVAFYQFRPASPFPPPPPPTTFINDVIVTRDAAYFTDSCIPVLYRVALGPTKQTLRPV
jgi:hypothetical protein